VRFQTNEAVAVQDPEVVLRALETCLRVVSPEVVRYGDRITLHGLGPSPKAVNYQDTTVLSVTAENDKTIINADVNFQASSILGDVPQDAVVRGKLDQVFDQMRTQIGLESKRNAADLAASHSETESSSSVPPDVPESANPPSVVPAASDTSTSTTDSAGSHSSAPVTLEEGDGPEGNPEEDFDAVREPMPVDVEEHWTRDEEDAALVAMLRREIRLDEPESDSPGPLKWAIAIVVLLCLVAGGIYLARTGRLRVPSRLAAVFSRHSVASTATTAAPSPAVPESAAPAVNTATTTPPIAASAPPTAASAPPAAAVAPPKATVASPSAAAATSKANVAPAKSTALANANVPDPKVWLERWAAAMRSRDPVAQASFYADPVSQYINQKNVSNTVLANEKRADIGRRHGNWTFSANDVVVENRTPSEATVQLVKHYMVESGPSQVSEIFVKTRMQLKVIDGQWKITSEQELRSPALASINPIDR
jgi:hypothetical protein